MDKRLIVLAGAALAACAQENRAPVASAGADLSAPVGTRVIVDGSASTDPDGDDLSFQWKTLEAPLPELFQEAVRADMGVTPRRIGRYVFELTVSDGELSASDQIVVDVGCQNAEVLTGWRADLATLPEKNPFSDCPDYRVAGDTLVPDGATMMIAPGALILVDPGVRFGTEGGQLLARGTPEERIRVRGSSEGRGTWEGLELARSLDTQLAYVTVDGGGAEGGAALSATGVGSIDLENVVLRRSAGFGLSLSYDSAIAGMRDCTFTENALGPARIHLSQVRDFTPETRLSGNDRDVLEVAGDNLNVESTWRALDVPYLLGDVGSTQVGFPRDTTIEQGVTMLFREGVGLMVRLGARFSASGVHFAGAAEGPGTWRGIAFSEGVHATLDDVTVEGGGGGDPWSASQGMTGRANVTVLGDAAGTSVTITNSELMGSGVNAMWIEDAPGVAAACTAVSTTQPILPACPFSR